MDAFPKVTESLIKALKVAFPPLPPQPSEPLDLMRERAGPQQVIAFLESKLKD